MTARHERATARKEEPRRYWEHIQSQDHDVARSLEHLERYSITLDDHPNLLTLLAGDKATAEQIAPPDRPEAPLYGAMPHFTDHKKIVTDFSHEDQYFSKHYNTATYSAAENQICAEGILLHQLKFGERLSVLTEKILSHNPPRSNEQGKLISLFGLSGSGKSTAIDAIRAISGSAVVAVDKDTILHHLFAKKVQELETAHGATVDQARSVYMHNRLSGTLQILRYYVEAELKRRGYIVVVASAKPRSNADHKIYIEHPDNINPTSISPADIPQAVESLYAHTEGRVSGFTNYDWDNPEVITDLNVMEPVTVTIPKRAHERILLSVKQALENEQDVRVIHNPRTTNSQQQRENFTQQLSQLLN